MNSTFGLSGVCLATISVVLFVYVVTVVAALSAMERTSSVPRSSTRLYPTSRRHCCQPVALIDFRTTSTPIVSTGRLTFSFLNVCSLTKSMICSSCDVIAILMSCASLKRGTTPILSLFDVCAPPDTKWSIVHARDHRQNCQPWRRGSCPSGVRLSSIALGVDTTSFELLCARVVLGSFFCNRGSNLPARFRGYHDHILCRPGGDPGSSRCI